MDVPLNTLKSYIHRAKKALSKRLRGERGDIYV